MEQNTQNLPRYKCHKEVSALQIGHIEQSPASQVAPGGSWDIHPLDESYPRITVSHAWYQKHQPYPGGYYVVYGDGYDSFSPASAFESGYAPLVETKTYSDGATATGVAPLPALSPHQQRVVDEKAELDDKRAKLTEFYTTPIFHGLPESEQSRLLRQGVAMRAYSQVLGERIAEF